ncbi:MAG TPA: hypothetical protein VMY59_09670 [Candidatus Thermoplasmatota archaeon]|nr:hypothetical protein [Candidatus Thermoplasmatota archaeon]
MNFETTPYQRYQASPSYSRGSPPDIDVSGVIRGFVLKHRM